MTNAKRMLEKLKIIKKQINKEHNFYEKLNTLIKLCEAHGDLNMPFYTSEWDEIIRILHNWNDVEDYKGNKKLSSLIQNAMYL